MSAPEQSPEIGRVSEVERVALDLASRVFGWQHLVRYSGMSADWLDLTLLAIVRSALAAEQSTPPAHGCANYAAPVTCLTAPSSATGRCDHCKEQA